jgi:hypothetical protein
VAVDVALAVAAFALAVVVAWSSRWRIALTATSPW